ncbi:uncharacterized protein LOC112459936 isoform X1 [Temnothorax curvispinosus]|uniref:Uncharacterized protein LOC112459936 isoform X1 n=1 Tax=Temnothorax curvispinosus TaxID=300111 RepID=A0A6J1QE89_9HYME|nr:uncharacterized protein LOC112459936 isoform X1 [Temnothorax curvispinosus]
MPLECRAEPAIQDLYAWLKTEPELDVQSTKHDITLNDNRKCIDTRTFTRPKKRSARMSFESSFEGLPPSTTDKEKLQDVTHIENVGKCLPATIGDKESVPPILKPSTKATMNVLSDENSAMSGQENMEAFLNLSQSKGIDSFINLGEPEFSDLLDVSQPSILNASVIASINESIFVINDVSVINKNMAQSISDMEESSNSDDVDKTFVMQEDDNSLDEINRTNTLGNTCKESLQLDKGLNETYNTGVPSGSSLSRSSLGKGEIVTLSSTFVTEPNANATFVQSQNEATDDVKSLDTTYLSLAKGAERPNSPVSINDTYIPSMRANKADLNVTCNVPSDEIESVVLLTRETLAKESALDISSKVPIYNQSTPMNPNMLDAAPKFATKHLDQPQPTVRPTLKAPTSLRRELLAEIQRSGERKLDSTYNHIPGDHPGSRDTKKNVHVACNENETNRFHTYKKTAFRAMANQGTSQNETAVILLYYTRRIKKYVKY